MVLTQMSHHFATEEEDKGIMGGVGSDKSHHFATWGGRQLLYGWIALLLTQTGVIISPMRR